LGNGYVSQTGRSVPFVGEVDYLRIYELPATEDLDSDGDGLTDAWERGYGRYQVVEGTFTWHEAVADARARGGHVASITSQSESDFVGAVLDGSYPVLWLGAGNWKAGMWQWITGESWRGYTNWHDGEPGDSDPYFPEIDYLQINYHAPDLSWSKYRPEQDPQPSGYLLEFGYPTDPFKADTDDDGIDDKVESDAGSERSGGKSRIPSAVYRGAAAGCFLARRGVLHPFRPSFGSRIEPSCQQQL